MYPRSIIHSGCVLLLIAASSESRRNCTNNDKQTGNFVNPMKNRDDKMQPTLNNSIKIDDETNLEEVIYNATIISNAKNNILKMYPSGLIHWCYIIQKNMNDEQNDESTTQYPLLINFMKDRDNRTEACNLDNVLKEMKYNGIIYFPTKIEILLKNLFEYLIYASFLVALLCLLLTFVVYTILPEFQSIHGYTLRVHVALLFIINLIMICIHKLPELKYCILLAYIYNFSTLSSFFWLNVICFDIWWTFRKVRSYRTNVKNREKKKFIIYSIYAWGITFILNVVCAITDYDSDKSPNDLIQMCKTNILIGQKHAMIYFSIPVGVIVIVNICFFILTIQTIRYHDRHCAKDLADLESNRYYKTKRKFGIYLKLFIVMGISWIMEIVSWCINDHARCSKSPIACNTAYLITILQSFIIFMIYVCQKKIMLLLLKRFDWQDPGKVSNSNDCPNTASNTTSPTSISETVPMQNISLSNQRINH